MGGTFVRITAQVILARTSDSKHMHAVASNDKNHSVDQAAARVKEHFSQVFPEGINFARRSEGIRR